LVLTSVRLFCEIILNILYVTHMTSLLEKYTSVVEI
jgi:hypothetical protein